MRNLLDLDQYSLLEKLNFSLKDKRDMIGDVKSLSTATSIITGFTTKNPKIATAVALASAVGNSWLDWKKRDLNDKMVKQLKKTSDGKKLFSEHKKLYRRYEDGLDAIEELFLDISKERGYDLDFTKYLSVKFNDAKKGFKDKKYTEVDKIVSKEGKKVLTQLNKDLKELAFLAKDTEDLYKDLHDKGDLK